MDYNTVSENWWKQSKRRPSVNLRGMAVQKIRSAAASNEPLVYGAIFNDRSLPDFKRSMDSIDKALASYPDRTERDNKLQQIIASNPNAKSRIDKLTVTRDVADKLLPNLVNATKRINKFLNTNRARLLSNDHAEVARAIRELIDVYPSDSIKVAGTLRRRRRMKIDGDYIRTVLAWADNIQNLYKYIIDTAVRQIGKTTK